MRSVTDRVSGEALGFGDGVIPVDIPARLFRILDIGL